MLTKSALMLLKMKYQMLGSLVKKTNYDTKISELEKKLTDYNHDDYITTPDVVKARLAQANLIKRQILMLSCQAVIEKLLQINQNIYLLKMS